MSRTVITIARDFLHGLSGLDDINRDDSGLGRLLRDMLANLDRILILHSEQRAAVANSGATDAVAETAIGVVLADGDLVPFVHPQGAVTAHDTNYATITFRLYRAGELQNTWTLTTRTTAQTNGTGNWTADAIPDSATALTTFEALKGDRVTFQEAKAASGVSLPARHHGFYVS